MNPATLSFELAQLQHEWLRGARARLLRTARIAHRQAVLEIGAGQGLAAAELADRCGRPVTAVDRDQDQVDAIQRRCAATVHAVCADACDLPFAADSFDLIFAQFAFLWIRDLPGALNEAWRVLRPGGVLVAIEPDYEAMIEYPIDLGLRSLWVRAMESAGARTHGGRRLAALALDRGPGTEVLLPDRYIPVAASSMDFLSALVDRSDADERAQLAGIRQRLQAERCFVHLPLFLLHVPHTSSASLS